MKSKYRVPVEMTECQIVYRDSLIEELKHRTGSGMVTIIAYKENQEIEPRTIMPYNTVLECRVGNQVSMIVITYDYSGLENHALEYGMREIVNRMMAVLIKAGAESLL